MEKTKAASKTEKLTKRAFRKFAREAVDEVMEYSPSFEYSEQVMEDSMSWYDEMKSSLSSVADAAEFVRKVVMTIVENYI